MTVCRRGLALGFANVAPQVGALADVDNTGVEVNVWPGQPPRLASAHSAEDCRGDQRAPGSICFVEDRAQLFPVREINASS